MMHENCWNNRKPPKDGFWAIDKSEVIVSGRIEKAVWIPNRWIDGAEKCRQPGKGFKPLPGCVGCTHLQSD